MPVKQVDVTTRQQRFIASQIKAGRYRDENEVLRAGLALLEKQQRVQKRETLAEMIKKGEDDVLAGRVTSLTSSDEIRDHGKRMLDKVIKRSRTK